MKIGKLLLLAVLVCIASSTSAQSVIANRTALDVLLGGNRADESFETLPIQGAGAAGGSGLLSSTNDWDGAGFNLVVPGITLESTGSGGNYTIWWNGTGFRGLSTKTIAADVGLRLDFWNPTEAFGIDLHDYPTFRTIGLAGITVYGADDLTVIYQDNAFDITDPANGTFFGFQNGSGIGAVLFNVTVPGPNFDDNNSPVIDNLAFSTVAVPEPTTLSLAIIATAALLLVRRHRKC
jgi:hypothetical protein